MCTTACSSPCLLWKHVSPRWWRQDKTVLCWTKTVKTRQDCSACFGVCFSTGIWSAVVRGECLCFRMQLIEVQLTDWGGQHMHASFTGAAALLVFVAENGIVLQGKTVMGSLSERLLLFFSCLTWPNFTVCHSLHDPGGYSTTNSSVTHLHVEILVFSC